MMLRLHQILLWDLEKIFSIYNKITTINDQIRHEKLQYDINRKAAEISALPSGKIDKYEYLTGKEILPSHQLIEEAKFAYSRLGKAFETQVLCRFKSCSRRVGDSRWWGSLTMVPARNKAKRLSSVNHTTKTIHHHHHHHHHQGQVMIIKKYTYDDEASTLFQSKKEYLINSQIKNLMI